MVGGQPGPQGGAQRKRRDPEWVRTLAITVLAVWAVAVSGALAWTSIDAANTRQVRLWTAQAIVLLALRDGLSTASGATSHLMAMGNVGFADDALSALRGNGLLLAQLLGTPEAASAEALNLTAASTTCIALGYETLAQMIAGDPSIITDPGFRQYADLMGHGLGTLAGFLLVRPDGTDPLGQIGPANVTVVRQDVAMLSSFYAPPTSGC